MRNMSVLIRRVPSEVMYLIIIDQMLKKYRDLIVELPNERFDVMVRKEVVAHLVDGKEPAEEIRTAILNVADDMMAGRDLTLRAGDYVALMNYGRKNKLI